MGRIGVIAIFLILFHARLSFCLSGIIWTTGNKIDTKYVVGYLWKNSDIVFLKSELVAKPVKGVSKSGKICGFVLSGTNKDTFFVSQIGIGMAEVRLSPLAPEMNYDKLNKNFTVYLDAYDCDDLRHYSPRMEILIITMKQNGITFDKDEYKWSIYKNSKIGTIVGRIQGNSEGILYKIIGSSSNLGFKVIERTGEIVTTKSFKTYGMSSLTFRVLGQEITKSAVKKKGVVTVKINLIPGCEPQIIGIPDQLDYYRSKRMTELLHKNLIVQQDDTVYLGTCRNQQVDMAFLSLFIRHPGRSKDICRRQQHVKERTVLCKLEKQLITLSLTDKTPVSSTKDKKLDYVLSDIKEEFTITWWMKRQTWDNRKIICIKKNPDSWMEISVGMNKPPLSASASQSKLTGSTCSVSVQLGNKYSQPSDRNLFHLYLPDSHCNSDNSSADWIHYALLREWATSPTLSLSVNGDVVSFTATPSDMLRLDTVKVNLGGCNNEMKESDKTKQNINFKELQIDSVSMDTNRPLSEREIKCLASCRDSLILLGNDNDKNKNENNVKNYVETEGASLFFQNRDPNMLLSLLHRISFVTPIEHNTRSEWDTNKNVSELKDAFSDVFVNLSLQHSNGIPKITVLPVNVIRVNFGRALRSNVPPIDGGGAADDTESGTGASSADNSDDISDSEIILKDDGKVLVDGNAGEPIRLLEGLQIRSEQERYVEMCSVRPIERRLIGREKLALAEQGNYKRLLEHMGMRIHTSSAEWRLEGKASILKYEKALQHLEFHSVPGDERRQFSVACLMSNDEYTGQAVVEIIQHFVYTMDNDISAADIDDNGMVRHNALSGLAGHQEDKQKMSNEELFMITKPRFVAVIIMAVMGGAAWSLVTAAISCYLMRQRYRSRNRGYPNASAAKGSLSAFPIQRNTSRSSGFSSYPQSANQVYVGTAQCDGSAGLVIEDDQLSMADLPRCSDDLHSLDSTSPHCELCEPCVSSPLSQQQQQNSSDSPITVPVRRSHTVSFPIGLQTRF